MVVKCLQCNSHSVFHAWLGVKSRVLEGCSCPNQVWISPSEEIFAQDFNKIEVWNSAEQKFISYKRFKSLCSIRKTEHSNLTGFIRE